MSDKKNKLASQEAFDDVDRLFARLGSKGADGYRDFTPGKLPEREPVSQVGSQAAAPPPVPAPARAVVPDPLPPPAPPILASIRPLRAEPAQRLAAVVPAANLASPLGELFQRLLQAEATPTAASPLRRMFGR